MHLAEEGMLVSHHLKWHPNSGSSTEPVITTSLVLGLISIYSINFGNFIKIFSTESKVTSPPNCNKANLQ